MRSQVKYKIWTTVHKIKRFVLKWRLIKFWLVFGRPQSPSISFKSFNIFKLKLKLKYQYFLNNYGFQNCMHFRLLAFFMSANFSFPGNPGRNIC